MRLPPPAGPAWNLRATRAAALGFLLGMSAIAIACLVVGGFPAAAAFGTSAIVFWCNWRVVKWRLDLIERWEDRKSRERSSRVAAEGETPCY